MKKVQKTLLLCTVISVCSGLMKASSLYDEVWHYVRQVVYLRARKDVRLNKELKAESKGAISMYEFYMLSFIRKHTIPFKNYKSKDLMPELEKYLNEIDGWDGSSGNIRSYSGGTTKQRPGLCSSIRANACALRLLYIFTACKSSGSGRNGVSLMMHNGLSRYLINV